MDGGDSPEIVHVEAKLEQAFIESYNHRFNASCESLEKVIRALAVSVATEWWDAYHDARPEEAKSRDLFYELCFQNIDLDYRTVFSGIRETLTSCYPSVDPVALDRVSERFSLKTDQLFIESLEGIWQLASVIPSTTSAGAFRYLLEPRNETH